MIACACRNIRFSLFEITSTISPTSSTEIIATFKSRHNESSDHYLKNLKKVENKTMSVKLYFIYFSIFIKISRSKLNSVKIIFKQKHDYPGHLKIDNAIQLDTILTQISFTSFYNLEDRNNYKSVMLN